MTEPRKKPTGVRPSTPDDPHGHFIADGTEPCIGLTDMFYTRAHGHDIYAIDKIATAKRLCAGCHRQFECLSKAIYRHEQFGIWGGRDFYVTANPVAIKRRKRTEAARLAREEAGA